MVRKRRTRTVLVSLLVGILTCGYYLRILTGRTRRAACSRVVYSRL